MLQQQTQRIYRIAISPVLRFQNNTHLVPAGILIPVNIDFTDKFAVRFPDDVRIKTPGFLPDTKVLCRMGYVNIAVPS